MSTGFSGNLGYPMPDNWAFDQFYEGTIGSGDGSIAIDKDSFSGRDKAVASVEPPSDPVYDARLRTFLLGDTQTSLTASQMDSYQNLLNNISLSVRNGFIEIYIHPSTDSLGIQFKVYTPDIPTGDGATTGLTTTITFKIKQKHFQLPETETVFSPDWESILTGTAIGAGVVLGVIVLITAAPEAVVVGGATAFISAFLALFPSANE